MAATLAPGAVQAYPWFEPYTSHDPIAVTHEMKLALKPHQERRLNTVMAGCTWVWNRGLALLEWQDWKDQWREVEAALSPEDLAAVLPTRLFSIRNVVVDKAGKAADPVYGLACCRVRGHRYNPQADLVEAAPDRELEALDAEAGAEANDPTAGLSDAQVELLLASHGFVALAGDGLLNFASTSLNIGRASELPPPNQWPVPKKQQRTQLFVRPATGEWIERQFGRRRLMLYQPQVDRFVVDRKPHWHSKPGPLPYCNAKTGEPLPITRIRFRTHKTLRGALTKLFNRPDYGHRLPPGTQNYVRGVLDTLAKAWHGYRSGIANRPRYKQAGKPYTTLLDMDAASVKLEGNQVLVSGYSRKGLKLGPLTVVGNHDRWQGEVANPVKILREGRDWYLQVTLMAPRPVAKSRQGRIIAIDPGGKVLAASSQGHLWEPRNFAKDEAKLARLNQGAAIKYRLGKSRHQERYQHFPAGTKIPRYQPSKRLRALYDRIAKLHHQMARRRRAWLHFLSDRIVDMADVIVVEKTDWREWRRQEEAYLDPATVQYTTNGAGVKKKVTRSAIWGAPGTLFAMLETKAKQRNKLFLAAPASYGASHRCSRCGHNHKEPPPGLTKEEYARSWRPDRDTVKCQHCGHTEHADTNAAQVLEQWAEQVLSDPTVATQKLDEWINRPRQSTRTGRAKAKA